MRVSHIALIALYGNQLSADSLVRIGRILVRVARVAYLAVGSDVVVVITVDRQPTVRVGHVVEGSAVTLPQLIRDIVGGLRPADHVEGALVVRHTELALVQVLLAGGLERRHRTGDARQADVALFTPGACFSAGFAPAGSSHALATIALGVISAVPPWQEVAPGVLELLAVRGSFLVLSVTGLALYLWVELHVWVDPRDVFEVADVTLFDAAVEDDVRDRRSAQVTVAHAHTQLSVALHQRTVLSTAVQEEA